MILSSDPTQALRRIKEQAQTSGESEAPQAKQTPDTEDEVEKTLVLNPDSAEATEQQAATKKPEPEKEHKEQSKPQPGIEEDETLVMHNFTFKPVKHDPK
jgi:hypothetical protein